MSDQIRAVALTVFATLIAWIPAHAADQVENGPVAVVRALNEAISARDSDAIMANLAEGSVQIQLRAAHPGMSDNPPLTADLRKNWEMVAAILFPASEVYERNVEITASTVDGEVATVWANTHTHTVRKGVEEPMDLHFSEVYLLVLKNDRWQVAVVADNRQPDNIVVAPEN